MQLGSSIIRDTRHERSVRGEHARRLLAWRKRASRFTLLLFLCPQPVRWLPHTRQEGTNRWSGCLYSTVVRPRQRTYSARGHAVLGSATASVRHAAAMRRPRTSWWDPINDKQPASKLLGLSRIRPSGWLLRIGIQRGAVCQQYYANNNITL